MKKEVIKKRIEKLKEEINYHRHLYHVLDKQEISEAALDSLKHELFLLEKENPEFITKDSPTQRVGGKALKKFKKVHHNTRMLSLEDAFSKDEMEDWEKRIKKIYPKGKYEYFGELKIDGFAISLKYKDGILNIASTRGDGFVGEDVTQNIKTIESIPLKLKFHKIKNEVKNKNIEKYIENVKKLIKSGEFEVRGEVYMSKKTFENINKERKKRGESLYANPRNTAAGSIRQLDPRVSASRQLDFLAYAIPTDFGQKEHKDEHDILKLLGFKTDKNASIFKSITKLEKFWDDILKKREKLTYQIDGLVISVNDNFTREKLGIVGKAPRGSIAFKFPAEESTTIINDIIVQVGRTGALTPVAKLKPVSIGGTLVSRASLHNEDEIKRLNIKIGDTVVVQRAGDVIPKIAKVFKKLRTGNERLFKMPKVCPICGESLLKKEGEVILKCVNKKCPAKNRKAMYHFTSKKAFDINGLGPKILDKLSDEGLITDASDIFFLKEGDLVPVERFAEKSASNLVKSINRQKIISLARFIYSLGILYVGEETSIILAKYLSKKSNIKNPADFLEQIKKENKESLESLKDVGPKVAESIISFFEDKYNIIFLQKLNSAGIIIKSPKVNLQKQIFLGKIFVPTGELKKFTRDEVKNKIRNLGGGVSTSVSKKTDFLLTGKSPGSKYEKAKKLGVKIISEDEFIKMIS